MKNNELKDIFNQIEKNYKFHFNIKDFLLCIEYDIDNIYISFKYLINIKCKL